MADLADAFQKAAMDNYNEAKTKLGYKATRWLQMAQEHGAVDAARRLIAYPELTSEGLTAMWQAKRLDLSVEALMLRPEFAPLFTDAERARAREILAAHNYIAPWDAGADSAGVPRAAPDL